MACVGPGGPRPWRSRNTFLSFLTLSAFSTSLGFALAQPPTPPQIALADPQHITASHEFVSYQTLHDLYKGRKR